ncbi:uncharacterized protein THITE_2116278 [Thermothielavioides terrestris NRRL 8126]|uniref:LYR motif-containing protein Cup1-like N-terminal domain-containing protein n=1 Tax=Thermothielavioides terrestris (strain ATCC 38088 / NRRL 8126) TaxID=578455 RepID=G2R178_THETT|nr:uncharacterized protein THITE_2116278 [Thermothielavioides terrestris NRRL 8126]AEO67368.1 hypothetical protein THITE_2116278 [Thermothielavioides terrestris NRRL 8126]
MSRPLRIPHPTTPLHVYRHLLREASYLIPIARPFVDEQIKARFRKHRDDDAEKSRQRLRQAHHELRALRAANAGDMARMRRVLLRAFGRVGRRRRELMADLVRRETPANTEELAKYAAETSAIAAERKLDWLDRWDVDKLRTFARSQVEANLINSPKPPLTAPQTSPQKHIPAENSWGRPLPRRLARTKLKKLWKMVADKCMPPLPKEEWERLGGLAEGRLQAQEQDLRWLPPPRRPVAQSRSGDDVPGSRIWDWRSYVVKPVARVDRQANRRNKLLSGAVDDNTPTGDPEPLGCHKYTARSWRRMLESIWQLTATMEKKPQGQGWKVVWGKASFQPTAASAENMEFFTDFPAVQELQPPRKRRS